MSKSKDVGKNKCRKAEMQKIKKKQMQIIYNTKKKQKQIE